MSKMLGPAALAAIVLLGCSKSEPELAQAPAAEAVESGFPALPISSSESVELHGRMSFWMFEGDAGCYGTLTKGFQEVQLWSPADACEAIDYEENAAATVVVTYRSDEQWGPGKTYSIVEFL